MDEKPVVVIEHLEDEFSVWLLLEYRHVSLIIGREHVWYTNIPCRYKGLMSKYGRVYCESVIELIDNGVIPRDKVIILDPIAKDMLRREELVDSYIIVGGILGDHPPRQRTWKLLSSKLKGVRIRNIGDGQYSIDGAVYYVYKLWLDNLKDYEYIDGVRIETPTGYIKLPFRYPLVNGEPLLAPGLIEYLRTGRIPETVLEELGLSK